MVLTPCFALNLFLHCCFLPSAAFASNFPTRVIPLSVTFRLAVIDIASGGWMTLSKRALRALHAAHSRPTLPLLQLLVTNRCVPPAAPRAAASWSRHAATWPPLQPSSSSTTWPPFFIRVSLFLPRCFGARVALVSLFCFRAVLILISFQTVYIPV